MEEALDSKDLKANNISQTLLVGGSTRMPIINKVITKIMKKAPVKGVNVDEELKNIQQKKIVDIKDIFDTHYFLDKKIIYIPS